jgi:hypothetical protein
MSHPIGVGSTVWVFDYNHRVYTKAPDGSVYGGRVIWREHWRPKTITGETSRSWIVQEHPWTPTIKIPKKDPPTHIYAFSEDEVIQRAWVNDHAHKIAEIINRRIDYSTLRKVAEVIGYKGDEDTKP